MAEQPLVGLGFLIVEVLRSHSDTPHSVGLLWTSDRPVAETSTWQHATFTRDRHHDRSGIRTRNSNKGTAADPHLRLRGHYHFYYYLKLARSLKSFGQACVRFSYGEIPVIGRPVRPHDGCSNLRLGEISFCSSTDLLLGFQFIIPDNYPQSSTFPKVTNATSGETAASSGKRLWSVSAKKVVPIAGFRGCFTDS
jgi:hypothetical protein